MSKKTEIDSILAELAKDIRKNGSSTISNADVQIINKRKVEEYDNRLESDIAESKEAGLSDDYAEIIVESVFSMSKKHIGALIIFPKVLPIGLMTSKGTQIKAPVTASLLEDIFFPGTKLHDGAAIIRRGIIDRAAVFVNAICGDDVGFKCGARHRAAMGITKMTDATALIVSEETGKVEISQRGKLEEVPDAASLFDILNKIK